MATVSQKVLNRISEGLKRFQPIVESAKIRDVNESDTVVLLTGILSEILGFDKYTEITTELAIRGTYCDLALKIDGKVCVLIEAKAIGVDLKELQVKQAVDYAANKGIDWVILTNGISWKVYKILFTKPIQNPIVFDIDFLKLRSKVQEDVELFSLLSKEAICKSSLEECYTQKLATNKFILGNLLYEDSVLNAVKRELKQIYPDIKVTSEEIKNVLINDVVRREIWEGEEAEEAKRKITRSNKKKEKVKSEKSLSSITPAPESVITENNPRDTPLETA